MAALEEEMPSLEELFARKTVEQDPEYRIEKGARFIRVQDFFSRQSPTGIIFTKGEQEALLAFDDQNRHSPQSPDDQPTAQGKTRRERRERKHLRAKLRRIKNNVVRGMLKDDTNILRRARSISVVGKDNIVYERDPKVSPYSALNGIPVSQQKSVLKVAELRLIGLIGGPNDGQRVVARKPKMPRK